MYLVVGECACRTWPLLFGTRWGWGRCHYCDVVPDIIAGPFTEQEYDQWRARLRAEQRHDDLAPFPLHKTELRVR